MFLKKFLQPSSAKIMTHGLGAIQQTNIINVVAGSLVFHAWLGFFLWNTITFQQYFWVGFVTLKVTLEYKVIIYKELFCWINKSQRSGHKGLIFQLSAQAHLKQKKKNTFVTRVGKVRESVHALY